MPISPARRAAFEILRRVEQESAYASVLLAAHDRGMRADDRALCHELVLGVLRKQLWLDRALEHFADRDIARIDLPVRLALRLGLYQLRFLSRIPPSAAVNESVNLVRAAGLQSAGSFTNAVLRRATREPAYDPTTTATDPLEKLAVETSHPPWLIERWAKVLGFEEAEALARANNESQPTAFRFTAKAIQSSLDLEQILKEISDSGAQLAPSRIAPDGWRITRDRTARGSERVSGGKDGGVPQAKTPALLNRLSQDGLIYFQDEASQLVSYLVAPRSSDRLLDVCAAPGSKTTHMAALAPQALIVCGDLHEYRLRTMNDLAKRQAAGQVKLARYDATCTLPFADRSFDRVLVDAPCSGTGTLRHNPEIRWRLQPSDIIDLSTTQKKILANAAATVRPGGRLIYSTCSVEPEENEAVARNFLKQNTEFTVLRLDEQTDLVSDAGVFRTWPHRHDVDGFFVASFERKG